MYETIDVNTGEVVISREVSTLRALALGSCIAVTAWDSSTQTAGLAHIMLPGKAPGSHTGKYRYALDAIDHLLDQMVLLGSGLLDIDICLVGAGNVLQKKDDSICRLNIESARSILSQKGISVRASLLGGDCRKSVFLERVSGKVWASAGDEPKFLLWTSRHKAAEPVFTHEDITLTESPL